MIVNHSQLVSNYKKPKRKTLKIVIISLVVLILGAGIWIGATAFSAIKKITAFSPNGGNLFSFLGDYDKNSLKGAKEGRTNILLLGSGGKNHPGGNLTDTIMVMSIDWDSNKVALISVPRDLWVKIPGYGNAKINEAFYRGESSGKNGGEVASKTLEDVLGIPMHYFVTIDFEGFKKIVNTVGGVDITVEKDLYDPFYPAANMVDYAPFKIKAGEHHMDGDLALKYARSRKTTSDFDRSKRQAQIIAAVKEKTLTLNTLGNPKKVTDLLNILGDHLRTNMSIPEIKALWDSIKDLDTNNIINKVFDTAADGPLVGSSDERGYYIVPKKGSGDFSELQLIAKNIFKNEPENELSIEILNGSGKSGVATRASQNLEKAGYEVSKVGDAAKIYKDSVVYNCTGDDAQETAETLADLLNAEVENKTSCANIDVQIIIGQEAL